MMKHIMLTFITVFSLGTVFIGCREEKTPEEKIEAAIDDLQDDLEEASDDVKDAVEDLQDNIEEAAEEASDHK